MYHVLCDIFKTYSRLVLFDIVSLTTLVFTALIEYLNLTTYLTAFICLAIPIASAIGLFTDAIFSRTVERGVYEMVN